MAEPWIKYQKTTTKPWEKFNQSPSEQPKEEDYYGWQKILADTKDQYPLKKVVRNINESLVKRGSNIAEEFKPKGEETIGDTLTNLPRRSLRALGQTAGLITDVVGDVIEPATDEMFDDETKNKLTKAIPDVVKKEAIDAIRYGGEKWSKFKAKNPEVAKDIEATANIATVAPIGKILTGAAKGVKAGAYASKKALKPLGEGAEAIADILEKDLARKSSQEAIDIVKQDWSSLTKGEREDLLAKGLTEKGSAISKTKLKTTPEDMEIAQSVTGIVKKDVKPFENINSIRTEIDKLARQTESLPGIADKKYNPDDLIKALDSTKEGSQVIFAGDATLENAYNQVVNEFKKIIGDKPKTLVGVLQARREFDQVIKKKFPTIFDKFNGDNVRANAVKDIRMAANDFIANSLPDGSEFKALLKTQNNMFKAIDRIAQNGLKYMDSPTLIERIKNHPWRSALIAGAVSGGGTILGGELIANILTNPLILSSFALYGTYKIGQKTISIEWLKTKLKDFLRTAGKTLKQEDKQQVTDIVTSIDNFRKK